MITNEILNKMDELHNLKKQIKTLKAKKQVVNDKKDALVADLSAKQALYDALEIEIETEVKALP